jgi:hypothetical protein
MTGKPSGYGMKVEIKTLRPTTRKATFDLKNNVTELQSDK